MGRSASPAGAAATLLSEGFSASSTSANAWSSYGDACLTAGTPATPATSLPACGKTAPIDAAGQGALALTAGAAWHSGMAISRTALPTANGLQITFTDYAFNGSAPGADGLAFFLTDASRPLPTTLPALGGTLGYSGTATQSGLAGAYLGVGLDEFGNFSNPAGHTGGPGQVPETIAVRGAASTSWQYLGGATYGGRPARMPRPWDQPLLRTRPVNAPTIRATLTHAGLLSIAIDYHSGSGFLTYFTESIVGFAGQPAMPAYVRVGFSAANARGWNVHQISGLAVSALTPPAVAATLGSEPFTSAATSPNLWTAFGDACLTAGDAATPPSSLSACGARAPLDVPGAGALQLNADGAFLTGTVIARTPLATANGLQITFTDYSFNGTAPAADGLLFFLTDASKPIPAATNIPGGSLGYANASAVPGLAGAYIGVAFDEHGNFSNPADGRNDGPGPVAETIAVRGSAATNWQYLGGATNAAGAAASLPFTFDQPGLALRPANAPTIRAILTPGGTLSVAIDRHDGSGFATYYSRSIVGLGGQAAVPAYVYFGLSASSGRLWNRHQIAHLTVSTANVAPPVAAAENPPQIASTNGSLVFNVSTVANAQTGQPQFSYDGWAVPPTLRLLPGDTLVVNLTNNLPVPPGGSGFTNTTNLHYHGLHVSPQAPGDDSIDMLAAPGQSLHYTLRIPLDHPPGLYWYHTHAHGEAERQTLAGMSGALIVDGIAAYTPEIASMTERVLVARDAPLAGSALPNANLGQLYAMKWAMQHGVAMHATSHGSSAVATAQLPGMSMSNRTEYHASSTQLTRNPYVQVDPRFRQFARPAAASPHCLAANPEAPVKALTLNGLAQPALRIAPGERQFWRLVNAGADTYLDVQVDQTQMQIVGLDGVPLVAGIGAPPSMMVSHWVLPPASRVEFIVTGPPAGTKAYLRTNCFDAGAAGSAMPAAILAVLDPSVNAGTALQAKRIVARVSPAARRFAFHTAAIARTAGAARTAAGIRATAVSATRTIYYTDQNNINGIAYDPAAPPQFYAQSGTVEEWTIQNTSSQVHTFHIHQVHFVVEAIDGTTQSPQYVMDNVNVPAATASGPGSVKLLLDFTDPTVIGTFLLHCHILSHEDAGMMAKIRIGTAPPMRVSAPSVTFANPSAALRKVTVTGGAAPLSVTGCAKVANAAVAGAVVSIVPAGAGACVLTVADGSVPSITATISVQVGAGAAAMSLTPPSVSFAALSGPAQNVAIVGGTAPYAVSGCDEIAAALVANAVVTVSPLAAGVCSLGVTDAHNNTAVLAVAVNAPPTGNLSDSLTFHNNAQRTGWYNTETVLTTANVGPSDFGQIATLVPPAGMTPMGKVYAQPLFVTNEAAVDGKRHTLIVVASANDQVYAFDETTRAVVWHRDFTNYAAGIRQQLWTDTGCPSVAPDIGIVSTPVIDRARDAVYVVVSTMENGIPYKRLHAISLGSGRDLIAPASIAGSVAMASGGTASVDPLLNLNRAALLEANGNIYVALGSHCDQHSATIHGWVIAYNASTLTQTGNLSDLTNRDDGDNYFLGAVWMSGFGPAADAAGNIYFATGNGPFDGKADLAMSVLKVPGNLNLGAASFFTPAQAQADSQADADLGSAGVILLPDQPGTFPHLLFAGGKCSANNLGCFKYLLNRDAPGGQRAGNAGALWSANVGGHLLGGPAFFADAAGAAHIVFGTGSPLATYTLGLAPVGLTVQSSASVGCLECRDSGSQPIVSSNGTLPGSAVVWALKTPGNYGGTISLYAFDALKMSNTLFAAPAGTWKQTPETAYIGGALVSPLVANGRVYVPADGTVTVFGLR